MIAPHALAISLSALLPLGLLARTFFPERDGPHTVTTGTRFSLEAWSSIAGDLDRWLVLLGNSGAVLLGCLGTCAPIALGLAVLVFRSRSRLRGPSIAALALAAALPVTVAGASYLALLGLERGATSPWILGLAHGLVHAPLATLLAGLALSRVDIRLEEAALVDGASAWRVLTRVTLPLARRGLLAVLALVAFLTLTDYSLADLVLVRTFAEEVYTQFALRGRPAEPTLVGLPLALAAAICVALASRGLARDDEGAESVPRRERAPGPGNQTLVSTIALAVAVSFLALPIANLLWRSGGLTTLHAYALNFRAELAVSLASSAGAGLVSGLLSIGIAWWIVRDRLSRILVGSLLIALATPAPLLGIGLIWLLNRPGPTGSLYDSPAVLVIAYTLRFLPIAVFLVTPAIRGISRQLESAARLDGADSLRVWGRIVAPLAARPALIAGLVVMILSIGELPCSLLVTPPGFQTVGSRFFSLMHYRLFEDAAALCLLAVASVGLPLAIIALALGRSRRGLR